MMNSAPPTASPTAQQSFVFTHQMQRSGALAPRLVVSITDHVVPSHLTMNGRCAAAPPGSPTAQQSLVATQNTALRFCAPPARLLLDTVQAPPPQCTVRGCCPAIVCPTAQQSLALKQEIEFRTLFMPRPVATALQVLPFHRSTNGLLAALELPTAKPSA